MINEVMHLLLEDNSSGNNLNINNKNVFKSKHLSYSHISQVKLIISCILADIDIFLMNVMFSKMRTTYALNE